MLTMKIPANELLPFTKLVGIGLRAQHYEQVMNTCPKIGWFEVHSENYFSQGGRPLDYLEKIRRNYPISLHGVGLSIGSADGIQKAHLLKLKNLITTFSPCLVSEHLSWSAAGGFHFNDLLPLPYTEESLKMLTDRINHVQNTVNRQVLIENISTYLQFTHSTIPEYEFINELAQRTHCGILLDINNLYVNSRNHGWNTTTYLDNIRKHHIQEIHLAGFMEKRVDNASILIDTHSQPVSDSVWNLYSQTLRRFGPLPTLIEWDQNIPELETLLDEAEKARKMMGTLHDYIA